MFFDGGGTRGRRSAVSGSPFQRPYRLSVRTAPFQGAETGSTPVGATLLLCNSATLQLCCLLACDG